MQVFYIHFLFLCVHLKTHIPAINGYSGWHLDVIATLANKSWTTNLCHTSWTHQFWFIVFLWKFGSFGPLKKSKLLQHSWYKLCCLTSSFQLVAFIGVLGNNFPANTGYRTLIYTVGKYQCWAVIASLKKENWIRSELINMLPLLAQITDICECFVLYSPWNPIFTSGSDIFLITLAIDCLL